MRDFIAFASCVCEAAAIDDRDRAMHRPYKAGLLQCSDPMVTPDRPVPSIGEKLVRQYDYPNNAIVRQKKPTRATLVYVMQPVASGQLPEHIYIRLQIPVEQLAKHAGGCTAGNLAVGLIGSGRARKMRQSIANRRPEAEERAEI